ncbi:kinesin light chain [Talaromyces pinophilus]|uniref:Kinesin light chain n=1 Tax=Talaromyces pinophilus TaxID=128442 RepID=A0A6V8H139_TALPI|nr:kinesin light chain [Talaromyces pinophilus]
MRGTPLDTPYVVSYLPLTTAWSAPAKCSSLFLDTAGYLFLNAPEYHNGVVGSPECVLLEVSIWWYQSLNSASPTAILLEDTISHVRKRIRLYFPTMRLDFDYRVLSIWQHGSPNQCSSTIPAGAITYIQPYSDTLYTCQWVQDRANTPHTAQQTTTSASVSDRPTSTHSNSAHGAPTSAAAKNNASGLDSKEKIGIGVGVSLGAIILVGLLAIRLLMRRKRNRQTIPPSETILETTNTKPELDSAPAPVKELDSANKIYYELGSSPISQPVAELSNDTSPPGKLLTEANISEMEERALEEETSGAYEAAEETYRQIVQWRESHQGPEHSATLTSIYQLVLVLNMCNKTGQADHLYRELMQRGETLPNLRPSWPLLGESLMLHGKNNEAAAEKLIRQELDLNMRVLGPEHLLTLFRQWNLANMFRRQLKLEVAEEAYRVALEMSDRVFGPCGTHFCYLCTAWLAEDNPYKHFNTLDSSCYNRLWDLEGKKDEAREIFRQTLERNIDKAGYDHPDTYPGLHNLKGELDEDEDLQVEITTPGDGSLPQGQKYRATVKIVRRQK